MPSESPLTESVKDEPDVLVLAVAEYSTFTRRLLSQQYEGCQNNLPNHIMGSSNGESELFNALYDILEDDVDTANRLLLFMADKKREGHEQYYNIFMAARRRLPNECPLRNLVEKMKADLMNLDSDSQYEKTMDFIWQNYLKPDQGKFEESEISVVDKLTMFQMKAIADGSASAASFLSNMALLSPEKLKLVIEAIEMASESFRSTRILAHATPKVLTRLAIGLTAAYLVFDVGRNIWKWYHNQITGKRCAKNIIDTFLGLAGGVMGGYSLGAAGVAIGTAVAPGVGTLIGGAVGSLVGSVVCSEALARLSNELTLQMFNIPREVAVENAYAYLGVHYSAANEDVNRAYKRLCLQHHPDKGGDVDEFNKLRCHFSLIRIHRGEVY